MVTDNTVFETKKTSALLRKFAVPSIISLLVLELYNMVDTVFVGRYIGAEAIGALTVAFPVQRLLIAIGMLIAVGTSTYVARSLGEQDIKGMKRAIYNAFFITTALLTTVSLFIYLFRIPVITFLGASSRIYPLAEDYISIILIGGVFQCLTAVTCYIITALGNPRITLYAGALGALCNIVIDFLLVGIFNFGISGAAIATVISQIIAFLYVVYCFKNVGKGLKLNYSLKKVAGDINAEIIWGIVTIGFSTFVIEISDAVVAVILNNMLFSKGGDAAIVIIGVITRVSMFMFIAIIGVASAMQPIVAYNYGAENDKKMKEALKVAITVVMLCSTSLWLILMVFSNTIIGVFLKDQVLLPQAVSAFRICISMLPSVSLYYVAIYYYQAIGEARRSFLLSIYRQIIVFIPCAIAMVQWFGIIGAWLAYPVSDIISFITSLYFIRGTFKNKPVKEEKAYGSYILER